MVTIYYGLFKHAQLPKFISRYLEYITIAEFKDLFRDL